MSIQDFRTQLEFNAPKSSLFSALYRLSRLEDLKALSVTLGGWADWMVSTSCGAPGRGA